MTLTGLNGILSISHKINKLKFKAFFNINSICMKCKNPLLIEAVTSKKKTSLKHAFIDTIN